MRVVLISTYELGYQPFGLASPAMWLKNAGAEVTCIDLAVQTFADAMPSVTEAEFVAFYLPMHTATKLAVAVIRRVKRLNPECHLAAYGLYAPVNEEYLRKLGVQTILGGEFEQGLVDWVTGLSQGTPLQLPPISLERQHFQPPDRTGLPPLADYGRLQVGKGEPQIVGFTQATRGCKHTCRHCPIVPVYNGRFRIIQREVVLADIRQQVTAGAKHITFGDPDFFNGPGHAIPLVRAMHDEFPDLTYDVTIKVEHLLKYQQHLPVLRDTGCLFIISAVESVDDEILAIFDKGHTRAEFQQAVALLQEVGLTMVPTFVTFTPWTTPKGYAQLLSTIEHLGLVELVAPIQYAIRLLIPAESKLLALPEVAELVRPFDDAALVFPWSHPDPAMDALYESVFKLVKANQRAGESRRILFERVWQLVADLVGEEEMPTRSGSVKDIVVPIFSEDWY